MDEKLLQMLEIIRNEETISQDELADRMGISARTVRTYANRINEQLAGMAKVEMKRGRGYRLEVLDPIGLSGHLDAYRRGSRKRVPMTGNERVAYLVNDLLTRQGWVTIDRLAEILFVSRRTIASDVHEAERMMQPYGLTLISRPHYGLKVEGPEMNRRVCLVHTLAKMERGGDPSLKDCLTIRSTR